MPRKTKSFRTNSDKATEAWESKEFNNYHGFKGDLLTWFIERVYPVVKRDKGKFLTALMDGTLTLTIGYKDDEKKS